MSTNPFEHSTYLLRKQFFKVFGGSFRIYDPMGNLAVFASLKAFKLKEDITLYPDEAKSGELLAIKARSILDWSAAYDVSDSVTGEKIGTLKRRGWKSLLKDEWVIMDAEDNDIGTIKEDSMLMAVLRRFATNLIPQTFVGEVGGAEVFRFKQHFNPFVQKMTLDFTPDFASKLDRRVGTAAAILLTAIEGRQQ
ncbi:MAG: hypothetical protein KBC96_11875 [Armatimonadetes bacterium]|nr:hypothetical protein [Armatimonadota bacterium]